MRFLEKVLSGELMSGEYNLHHSDEERKMIRAAELLDRNKPGSLSRLLLDVIHAEDQTVHLSRIKEECLNRARGALSA